MTKRLTFPPAVVLRIAQRDKWTCHVCDGGWRRGKEWRWTIDHDIALANGGTNHDPNLRLAHARCNGLKGSA